MPARAVAAVLVLALAPSPGAGSEPLPPGSTRTLHVTGEGRVSVRPDTAVVHAGVEATGKDLARTVADASARMRRVLAALSQAGVPDQDVRTTRHDVSVQRAWKDGRQGEITGYAVSDEVRVTVRELDRLPAVLDRVVAAGSNALRGLSFEKDDPASERREALSRAVADARAKAEALAKASGVELGAILEIAEAGTARPIPLVRRAALAASAEGGAPVSPGELEISAGVDVTWAIR